MSEVSGPYWINYVNSAIHVCGRHGKIIERYTDEDAARSHLKRLQAGLPEPVITAPRLLKAERDLLNRAREGIQFRGNDLMGVFILCAERGWIVADRAEYGLHVTLTNDGLRALAAT